MQREFIQTMSIIKQCFAVAEEVCWSRTMVAANHIWSTRKNQTKAYIMESSSCCGRDSGKKPWNHCYTKNFGISPALGKTHVGDTMMMIWWAINWDLTYQCTVQDYIKNPVIKTQTWSLETDSGHPEQQHFIAFHQICHTKAILNIGLSSWPHFDAFLAGWQ